VRPHYYGARYVLGEFASPRKLEGALPAVVDGKFGEVEIHTPYPLHHAYHIVNPRPAVIPRVVFFAGLLGVTTAWAMQWWCNAIDYPINVGGRPLNSLPSWIPIMFELMVLFGSFGAFFGIWVFARLPQPYHPVFKLERFRSASIDRFWVRVRLGEGADEDRLVRLLRELGASHVDIVSDDGATA
jgi:hypothetical protein